MLFHNYDLLTSYRSNMLLGELDLVKKDGTREKAWAQVLINGTGPLNKWKCIREHFQIRFFVHADLFLRAKNRRSP